METFTGNDLLEPIEIYRSRLKDAFHDNAEKQFQEMTDRAKTNVQANQDFCKIYYDEMAIVNRLKRSRNWRIFFLVMTFILVTAAMVLGVLFVIGKIDVANAILFGVLCFVAGIGLIVLAIFLIKKITELQSEINKHLEIAEKAKADAWNEMLSLFNLYEYNMAASLMTKTTPLLQLDPVFDGEKYEFLHEKYGYEAYQGNDISTVFVQSGSILGNPFVFEKNYVQTMRDHTYSGHLTISWTERVYDGNGKSHTEHRTQTLTAYYTAPEPCYYLDTWLIYGNEAAPNLSFSRYPTNVNNMSDKQIERFVKKTDKKLDKKVAKDLTDGDDTTNFTKMDNEEFDALFGGVDRDNEVEYRLLFTPLAQKNMLALLKGKEVGFGDDFIFKKKKKLNYIKSQHQQNSDSLDKDPETLKHFDWKEAKAIFVNYCDKYLKDVFFDLAPLISIPLYQQHKTIEYIYEKKFNHNVTQAEAEAAANSHNINFFKHPATRSLGVILKSRFMKQEEDSDICEITAHSFQGFDRVEYVPVVGGDGKTHMVPVPWIEYDPISKVTPILVKDTKQDKATFDQSYGSGGFNDLLNKFNSTGDIIYKKRIFSFIMKDKN